MYCTKRQDLEMKYLCTQQSIRVLSWLRLPWAWTTDDDLTPGRPDAPIYIDESDIMAWSEHDHCKYASLEGEHKGNTLWWDGAQCYKLSGGRIVRIRASI